MRRTLNKPSPRLAGANLLLPALLASLLLQGCGKQQASTKAHPHAEAMPKAPAEDPAQAGQRVAARYCACVEDILAKIDIVRPADRQQTFTINYHRLCGQPLARAKGVYRIRYQTTSHQDWERFYKAGNDHTVRCAPKLNRLAAEKGVRLPD